MCTSWPTSTMTTVVPVSWQSGIISRFAMSTFSRISISTCFASGDFSVVSRLAQAGDDVVGQDVGRRLAQLGDDARDLVDVDVADARGGVGGHGLASLRARYLSSAISSFVASAAFLIFAASSSLTGIS